MVKYYYIIIIIKVWSSGFIGFFRNDFICSSWKCGSQSIIRFAKQDPTQFFCATMKIGSLEYVFYCKPDPTFNCILSKLLNQALEICRKLNFIIGVCYDKKYFAKEQMDLRPLLLKEAKYTLMVTLNSTIILSKTVIRYTRVGKKLGPFYYR